VVGLHRWRSLGVPPALGEVGGVRRDIHVWLLHLDAPECVMRRLAESLDARERARAGAFVFGRDRGRYVAAHGLVRRVLAGYLGVSASEVAYGYEEHGKPYPMVSGTRAALRFSLSHSANLCLCAVATDREVGVDIEQIRADRDHAAIAGHYFSRAEQAAIRALPATLRLRAFYDCWTRKEACLKASADGLRVPLDSFDVPVTPDPLPVSARTGTGRHSLWLSTLPAVPGFAAALAVVGHGGDVVALSLDYRKADNGPAGQNPG
jgi:4'-phosphopantetheinyl transferase